MFIPVIFYSAGRRVDILQRYYARKLVIAFPSPMGKVLYFHVEYLMPIHRSVW
jgi:hypothetical protein